MVDIISIASKENRTNFINYLFVLYQEQGLNIPKHHNCEKCFYFWFNYQTKQYFVFLVCSKF